MKHESVWARSFTRKEQKTIIKRLIPYAMEFKGQFITAIVFALILSLINIALPRSLQYYLDHYLTNSNTTMNMIWAFAGLYFLGTIISSYNSLPLEWVLNERLKEFALNFLKSFIR